MNLQDCSVYKKFQRLKALQLNKNNNKKNRFYVHKKKRNKHSELCLSTNQTDSLVMTQIVLFLLFFKLCIRM